MPQSYEIIATNKIFSSFFLRDVSSLRKYKKVHRFRKNMGDFSRNVGGKRKILAQNHNFVREFTFIIVLFLRLFPNKT